MRGQPAVCSTPATQSYALVCLTNLLSWRVQSRDALGPMGQHYIFSQIAKHLSQSPNAPARLRNRSSLSNSSVSDPSTGLYT